MPVDRTSLLEKVGFLDAEAGTISTWKHFCVCNKVIRGVDEETERVITSTQVREGRGELYLKHVNIY